MRKNKSGISLIVLVITIIVMIILAGSIIISLSNSGIIGKSQEAVDAANLQEVQQIAALAWADAYLDKLDGETVDFEERVKQALKDNNIKVENYNIVITENGVEVSTKSSDTSGEESGDQVVEETDSLKGTWIFNEQPNIDDITAEWQVAFTNNGITYSKLKLEPKYEADAPGTGNMYYDNTWIYGGLVYDWYNGVAYSSNPYTVINITSKYEDVTNGQQLLTWLQSNATKVETFEKPQISISGTTLTITPVENATGYDIYVNGSLKSNKSSTTVDLTKLYLNVGTYTIAVKATANGFEDSTMSNSATYSVTQFTEVLTGTWNFNSTISATNNFTSNVTFKSNADTQYESITIFYEDGAPGPVMSYDNQQAYSWFDWTDGPDNERTPYNPIVITSSISDVTNPDKLMEFLLANAVKQ